MTTVRPVPWEASLFLTGAEYAKEAMLQRGFLKWQWHRSPQEQAAASGEQASLQPGLFASIEQLT